MSIDTIESTSTTVVTEGAEPGDHDLYAHYVKKDAILLAAVEGVPAIALCKKQWVPGRDPLKFQVCPECKDIYENVVGTNLPDGGAK